MSQDKQSQKQRDHASGTASTQPAPPPADRMAACDLALERAQNAISNQDLIVGLEQLLIACTELRHAEGR